MTICHLSGEVFGEKKAYEKEEVKMEIFGMTETLPDLKTLKTKLIKNS